MLNNNYYDIAFNDLGHLQLTLNSEYFNQMTISCQQISEKALKSVAELCISDDKIFKSHNLRQIHSAICSEGINLDLDDSDLAYLKDFYFDARYPGDNFVEVKKYEFIKALKIMYRVINSVNKFRIEKELSIINFDEKYPDSYTDSLLDSAINAMEGNS
jgi:HEPN domain-containing protein